MLCNDAIASKAKEYLFWVITGFDILFFYGFYTEIHPICLLDTDDYGYAFFHRSAIPLWGRWNPAKVLPETLFGLVSEFGAFIIFPIVGDLFYAETFSYALIVSIFIVLFSFQLYKFLKMGGY